jgi:hypothetical protein
VPASIHLKKDRRGKTAPQVFIKDEEPSFCLGNLYISFNEESNLCLLVATIPQRGKTAPQVFTKDEEPSFCLGNLYISFNEESNLCLLVATIPQPL